MTEMIRTKMIVGRISGTVMCQNVWVPWAPSMAAASYSSLEMFTRPLLK